MLDSHHLIIWLGLFYGLDHDLRNGLNGPGILRTSDLWLLLRMYSPVHLHPIVYRPTKSDGLMTYGPIGVVAAATLLSALPLYKQGA